MDTNRAASTMKATTSNIAAMHGIMPLTLLPQSLNSLARA
jgi:hypothetical protein